MTRKILSLLIGFSLIFTNAHGAEVAASLLAGPERFRVPASLGSLVDTYAGPDPRTVVLIQDLHINYGAQRHIAGILRHYAQKKVLPAAIGVEGMEGPMDLSLLATLPDAEIRAQVADYFVRQGEMSGAGAFAVESGQPHLLYGIENEDYYARHKKLFQTTFGERTQLWNQLQALEEPLQRLKARATSDLQKKAAQIERDLGLLKRLLKQQVTENEVRDVATHLSRFFQTTQTVLQIPKEAMNPITQAIRGAIEFYAMAIIRERPMVENTLRLLNGAELKTQNAEVRKNVVVLVAGGFHTPGLTTLLRSQGISYIVITPRIDRIDPSDESLYEKRLMDQHVTLQEVLNDPLPEPTAESAMALTAVGRWICNRETLRTSVFGIAYRVLLRRTGSREEALKQILSWNWVALSRPELEEIVYRSKEAAPQEKNLILAKDPKHLASLHNTRKPWERWQLILALRTFRAVLKFFGDTVYDALHTVWNHVPGLVPAALPPSLRVQASHTDDPIVNLSPSPDGSEINLQRLEWNVMGAASVKSQTPLEPGGLLLQNGLLLGVITHRVRDGLWIQRLSQGGDYLGEPQWIERNLLNDGSHHVVPLAYPLLVKPESAQGQEVAWARTPHHPVARFPPFQISGPGTPTHLAYDALNQILFVAYEGSDQVCAYNAPLGLRTGPLLHVEDPRALALDPRASLLYVLAGPSLHGDPSIEPSRLIAFDAFSGKEQWQQSLDDATDPRGMVLDSSRDTLYVLDRHGVTLFNMATRRGERILREALEDPRAIAIDPQGAHLAVLEGGEASRLRIFSIQDRDWIGSETSFGRLRPRSVAYTANGRLVVGLDVEPFHFIAHFTVQDDGIFRPSEYLATSPPDGWSLVYDPSSELLFETAGHQVRALSTRREAWGPPVPILSPSWLLDDWVGSCHIRTVALLGEQKTSENMNETTLFQTIIQGNGRNVVITHSQGDPVSATKRHQLALEALQSYPMIEQGSLTPLFENEPPSPWKKYKSRGYHWDEDRVLTSIRAVTASRRPRVNLGERTLWRKGDGARGALHRVFDSVRTAFFQSGRKPIPNLPSWRDALERAGLEKVSPGRHKRLSEIEVLAAMQAAGLKGLSLEPEDIAWKTWGDWEDWEEQRKTRPGYLLLLAYYAVTRYHVLPDWPSALARIGRASSVAYELLLKDPRDQDPRERERYARNVALAFSRANALEREAILSQLENYLSDKDWRVRHAAARFWGELGRQGLTGVITHRGIVSKLLQGLDDPISQVRCATAWALGHSGDRSVLPTLRSRLDDADWNLRAAALRALAMLAPDNTVVLAQVPQLARQNR